MKNLEKEQSALTINKHESEVRCYHCGDYCQDESIMLDEKIFCCNGCKTVYEILTANQLCEYYSFERNPGIKKNENIKRNYDYLEDADLKNKLIDFTDGTITSITLNIPQMHCSSCIWILENLYKLNNGIINSQVNFLQKTIKINFNEKKTYLKEIFELLASIGYEPTLNLEQKEEQLSKSSYKNLYFKIGIAGFCFGNVMLLSFPEYLSIGANELPEMKKIFAYINILLAIPVFFFSASDYFSTAWKGLKKKIINIDVPIALGIFILFLRSIIEIIFNLGPGFIDSLTGLVFFLLIGKLFQNKTYDTLNFERNYKSYFPISITLKESNVEKTIPIEKLSVGSRIVIRNDEIIPADSILIKGRANIDYSFVTGESIPVEKKNGDVIYAGGKQIGEAIEVETIKEVSQSYLTQLWNDEVFQKNEESRIISLANSISKYFTIIILSIAGTSAAYWFSIDSHTAFNVFTAVLIVACPCALALSTPFTLGNTLRIFGKNKFYLKNTHVIEKLASINSVVFDKTGTITENSSSDVNFDNAFLNHHEKTLLKSAVRNSSHPLSKAIYWTLPDYITYKTISYEEIPGEGIIATINNSSVKVGNNSFVNDGKMIDSDNNTKVYISIDNIPKGYLFISNKYRTGLKPIIENLKKLYHLALLSGDGEGEKHKLKNIFGDENNLFFRQSPRNKLDYIKKLQADGKKVLMVGDGLNDAGALKQSDVGISISDNVNNFSPACDGILDSKMFHRLNDLISFAIKSKKIIIASFIISFIYNIGGIVYAVTGTLTPIVAAILMPLSSISVVLFTSFSTNFAAKKEKLL
jgi:Cu+-exporting ATPase